MADAKICLTDKSQKLRNYYSVYPWQCCHFEDRSDIRAYVEANGKWEMVMTVFNTGGCGHEDMATFLTNLINDNIQNRPLWIAAQEALELCLESDRLNFSSEQAADAVIARLKKRTA
ncbi:MAG: hypothetical protein WAO98_08900 [Alphaproteobacteria bacterium]